MFHRALKINKPRIYTLLSDPPVNSVINAALKSLKEVVRIERVEMGMEASIPKFGARDETGPRSGEGFIVIFNRVKEENQIASTTFPSVPTQPVSQRNEGNSSSRSKLYQSGDICLNIYANQILVEHAVLLVRLMSPSDLAIHEFRQPVQAFAFGYPSVDTVIERYLSENTREGGWVINTSTSTGHDHRAVQESRREYEEALAKKEEETKRVEMLKEGGEVGFGSDRFWWDRSIQGMGLEELEQYVASMEELKKNVGIRVDELEKASNSPSRFLDLDSGVHAIENFSTN
ncbi:hypothetical protein OIU78_000034 [Salix suchowensis]|nr:hypothetical protein OIU78_000034 [Salix suchowensis]